MQFLTMKCCPGNERKFAWTWKITWLKNFWIRRKKKILIETFTVFQNSRLIEKSVIYLQSEEKSSLLLFWTIPATHGCCFDMENIPIWKAQKWSISNQVIITNLIFSHLLHGLKLEIKGTEINLQDRYILIFVAVKIVH